VFATWSKILPYLTVIVVSSILVFRVVDLDLFESPSHAVPLSDAWEITYGEGKARARQEGRVLMLYFGADWCAPCTELEEKTFVDKEVTELLRSVVPVKIDGSEMSGSVSKLFERYRVYGLPEIVFVGSKGAILESLRISGFIEGEELAAVLRDL